VKALLGAAVFGLATFLAADQCGAGGTSGMSIAASQSGQTGIVLNGLALSLTPRRLTAHLGDQLSVTVELRNVSRKIQPLYYEIVQGRKSPESASGFSFTIVNQNTARYVPIDPGASSDVPVASHQLAPKMSAYLRLRLDTSYQFRTAGVYLAIVSNTVSYNDGEKTVRTTLQSNPITMAILPRRVMLKTSPLPVESPAVEIGLESDRPAYAISQPIFVRLSVRNITNAELDIATGPATGAECDLIMVDVDRNPIGPPHGLGPPYWWATGGAARASFPPNETAMFGFLNGYTANIQRWEGLSVSAPGIYAIAAFLNRGWWLSSSAPVGIRVLTQSAAKSLPGNALNDPRLNRSVQLLLSQYHEILARSAAMIARVRSTANTEDPYLLLRSAAGEDGDGPSIGDRLERLPGVGNPTSPYVNVHANFLESIRHVLAAADEVLLLLPSNAPSQSDSSTQQPLQDIKSRLGMVSPTLPPTPQPISIPRCKLAGALSELNAAEYFYDVVKSEMGRRYASLGDALSPPAVHSVSAKCH
jgi:hypothetical protein